MLLTFPKLKPFINKTNSEGNRTVINHHQHKLSTSQQYLTRQLEPTLQQKT